MRKKRPQDKKRRKGKQKSTTIEVNYLARVEGEGRLYVKVTNNKVEEVQLNLFEPPRFFEAFLQGRSYLETPDITARICGICPVAYQMSSVHAIENALQTKTNPSIRALRRLLYCGEWIESHALHVHLLHAPDFLGYEDAIQMAKDHPKEVERGLKMKKTGNDIVNILGGREIHPINVRVGGFYRIPEREEFDPIIERLKQGMDAAADTCRWVATLPFPDFDRDYEYVALSHPDEYPFNEGRLISNKGLNISVDEYEQHFTEEHVSHSTALHSQHKGSGPYFVGPMARFNLNFEQLSPLVKEIAKEVGLEPPCNNPFKGIIIRSLETLQSFEEALKIIDTYEVPEKPSVELEPKPSTGCAATEAPRGLLYHRYRIDRNAKIAEAKIVPPTSQNQKTIENDLVHYIPDRLHKSKEKLTWECEQAVRNYDPCISCSTHFLKLDLDEK